MEAYVSIRGCCKMALPWAQDRQSNNLTIGAFAGKWTEICLDGNPFVILTPQT